MIKDHVPTLAMVAALLLILTSLVTLALCGISPSSPILLGLVSAASSMAGAIGGFSMNASPRAPSQVNNSPGALVVNDSTGELPKKSDALDGQKEI